MMRAPSSVSLGVRPDVRETVDDRPRGLVVVNLHVAAASEVHEHRVGVVERGLQAVRDEWRREFSALFHGHSRELVLVGRGKGGRGGPAATTQEPGGTEGPESADHAGGGDRTKDWSSEEGHEPQRRDETGEACHGEGGDQVLLSLMLSRGRRRARGETAPDTWMRVGAWMRARALRHRWIHQLAVHVDLGPLQLYALGSAHGDLLRSRRVVRVVRGVRGRMHEATRQSVARAALGGDVFVMRAGLARGGRIWCT